MAAKRTAKEAFGPPKAPLSAAAAARQAKALKDQAQQNDFVEEIAGEPYNGHHSGNVSEEEVETVVALKKSNVPEVGFSTFSPADFLPGEESNGKAVQLVMKADQTAIFIGEYDLEVLKGVVGIYGALLHPDSGSQRVYALSTHALPVISARTDTLIRISSTKSGIGKLGKLSPLFRNIGVNTKDNAGRSFQFLESNLSDPLSRPLVPLEIDDGTRRVLSRLHANFATPGPNRAILAIGPKSSGKSTFNRLLSNMLLTRPGQTEKKIWYLDLDPGQPEFGPPGQVSLISVSAPVFGPPYTHPASTTSTTFKLVRSHTLAATTFKDDAEHYLTCATDLISLAATSDPLLPMVINSCGWTSGLGASTLISLIRFLPSPPEVVLLGESPDSDLAQSVPSNCLVHVIPKRVRVQGVRTPAEQRAMSTMAYLHQKTAEGSWNPKAISTLKPWILPYAPADGERGVKAILSYGQAPYPDFLAETLDGSVVAIVATEAGLVPGSDIHRTDVEGLPYLPESRSDVLGPWKSECLGLGLIRGIDVERKEVQLLTPIDLGEVGKDGKELILVRGGFDSPDWAYLEDLHAGSGGTNGERPWVTLTAGDGSGGGGEHGKVWRVRRPPLAGGK